MIAPAAWVREVRRRLGRRPAVRGHIDASTGNRFAGWAFSPHAPILVEALIGGRVVASVEPSIARPDLALAFPGSARAERSGFILQIPAGAIPRAELYTIDLSIRPLRATGGRTSLRSFRMASSDLVAAVAAAPDTGIVGPFPQAVIDAVASVWPGACDDLESVEGQSAFVAKLQAVFQVQELRSIPAIADYARYVRSTWAHCKFVENFFPAHNSASVGNAADFHCKPNSVFEIFAIIHQLYVLKSYRIGGDFAEFGCFKGFSSAMLSFACSQLDLQMHIFDSFEGLPAVENSSYNEGQYCGNLEEVQVNVARFGAIDCVSFHKGFFSETFSRYSPPELLCLWMDVDLEVSSRDLMVAADRLDPRSTIFSHECSPDIFQGHQILSAPNPDNPIPPMLERFEQLGRPLTGRFQRGNTGAFWSRDGGIAAIDNAVLMTLVDAMNAITD